MNSNHYAEKDVAVLIALVMREKNGAENKKTKCIYQLTPTVQYISFETNREILLIDSTLFSLCFVHVLASLCSDMVLLIILFKEAVQVALSRLPASMLEDNRNISSYQLSDALKQHFDHLRH